MQNEKANSEQAYRTLLIIWAALFMSQCLFVVLLYVTKPALFNFDLTKPLLGDNALIVILLAVTSVTNLVISLVRRRSVLEQSVTEQSIGLVQTAMIVGCALSESIALFGLFLAFSFDYQYFFIFSILAAIGMLLHLPRRSDVHAASFKNIA